MSAGKASQTAKLLSGVVVIANAISILGAVSVISSIVLSICRRRNRSWKRLGAPIFALSVSNLLLHCVVGSQALFEYTGGVFHVTSTRDQTFCQIMFSLVIATSAASGLWTVAIAMELNGYLYAAVRQPLSRRYLKYHCPIWSLSFGSLLFLLLRKRQYFFEFACGSQNLVNFIFLDVLGPLIFVLIMLVSVRFFVSASKLYPFEAQFWLSMKASLYLFVYLVTWVLTVYANMNRWLNLSSKKMDLSLNFQAAAMTLFSLQVV
jgi:hypothetical protein